MSHQNTEHTDNIKHLMELEAMETEKSEEVNREKRLCASQLDKQRKKPKQNEENIECQLQKHEIEAMETEVIVGVNEEMRPCLNHLEDKTEKQKQNENPLEIQTRKGNIEENKIHPQLNEGEKELKDLVNSLLERFDTSRQQKLKKLMNLVKQELFEDKHSKIKGQFTFAKQTYLFIDNLYSEGKPDLIDTVLCQFDENVQIRHQWKKQQCRSYLWEGAVAVFGTPEKAITARSQLRDSEYVTVMHMQEVLDVLIEAEIRYPKPSETSTVLVIRGQTSIPQYREKQIWTVLEQFGQVTDIKFKPDDTPGEICRVWYRYASHAIIAKLIVEKSTFKVVGRVSAEVIMTRKEKSILDYMRNYIRLK